jgi:hypothetical protein
MNRVGVCERIRLALEKIMIAVPLAPSCRADWNVGTVATLPEGRSAVRAAKLTSTAIVIRRRIDAM